MSTRTFIRMMLILLVFTGFLLAAAQSKQQQQNFECPAGGTGNENIQVQSADGGMILESVSRHLLSAVQ